jgi:hypothetical protein
MKTKHKIMKRSILKNSRFLLILGLLWIPNIVNSQNLKLSRKELKEASKAEKVNKYKELSTLLESRRFVFEADSKSQANDYLGRISADRNYVRVDSLTAFIQFEKWIGNSKVPVQTWEGNIVNWELVKNDKKLYYNLQFKISTVIENYYLFIYYDSTAKLKIGSTSYLGYIKQL